MNGETLEQDYYEKLLAERTLQKEQAAAEEKTKPAGGISFLEFGMVLSLAIVADLIDYVGGFVPGIGDILDIGLGFVLGIWAAFRLKRNPLAKIISATLVELIPFGDFIPSWTIGVLSAYIASKKAQ